MDVDVDVAEAPLVGDGDVDVEVDRLGVGDGDGVAPVGVVRRQPLEDLALGLADVEDPEVLVVGVFDVAARDPGRVRLLEAAPDDELVRDGGGDVAAPGRGPGRVPAARDEFPLKKSRNRPSHKVEKPLV